MDRNQSRPKITNRVRDHFANEEQLFMAAEQLRDLQDSPGWQVLIALLGELRETEVGHLTQVLASRSDYAHKGGRVEGLDAAREVVQAVIDHADKTRTRLEAEVREGEASRV